MATVPAPPTPAVPPPPTPQETARLRAYIGLGIFVLAAIITGPITGHLSVKGFDPVRTCGLLWWLVAPIAGAAWYYGRELCELDPAWSDARKRWALLAVFHRYWLSATTVGIGVFSAVAKIAQQGMNAPHTWGWRIAVTLAAIAALMTASGIYGVARPNPGILAEDRRSQIWRGVTEVVAALIVVAFLMSLRPKLVELHQYEQQRTTTTVGPIAGNRPEKVLAERPDPAVGGVTVDSGPKGPSYLDNN